jgi:biotin synthase
VGANSIFSSDDGHMLTVTTPCPGYDADQQMLSLLGLEPRAPFVKQDLVKDKARR